MSRLLKTLRNLENKQPLYSREVVILFTPAITKDRFDKEKKNSWLSFATIKKEFVLTQTRFNNTWEHYRTKVIHPIVDYLTFLENNSEAKLTIDATYKDFQSYFTNPEIKLLILVAHHIQQDGISAIEFADSPIPSIELQQYIKQYQSDNPTSLMLIVCDTSKTSKGLYSSVNINSIFWASWKMPLIGGMNYIATFVSLLDSSVTTLSDAHHQAIQLIVNSFNVNNSDEATK